MINFLYGSEYMSHVRHSNRCFCIIYLDFFFVVFHFQCFLFTLIVVIYKLHVELQQQITEINHQHFIHHEKLGHQRNKIKVSSHLTTLSISYINNNEQNEILENWSYVSN